jgi:hypothetical protein
MVDGAQAAKSGMLVLIGSVMKFDDLSEARHVRCGQEKKRKK